MELVSQPALRYLPRPQASWCRRLADKRWACEQAARVDVRAWLVEATEMLVRASEDGGVKAQEAVHDQLLERDRCACVLFQAQSPVCISPSELVAARQLLCSLCCAPCPVNSTLQSALYLALHTSLIACSLRRYLVVANRNATGMAQRFRDLNGLQLLLLNEMDRCCAARRSGLTRKSGLCRYLVVANRNATGMAQRFRDLNGLQLLLLNEMDSIAAGRTQTLRQLQRLTEASQQPTDDFVLQVHASLATVPDSVAGCQHQLQLPGSSGHRSTAFSSVSLLTQHA